MPLLGAAAMLLSFDVEAEHVAEHDRWHTHEHLPERLTIPGFLRGTRWVAVDGAPRYLVLYEVESLATLESAPYRARLDQPSPWTARMMPHYRGMSRGLCAVLGSVGAGLAGAAALIRFSASAASASALHRQLLEEVLPRVADAPGLLGAHLLQGARAAAMTAEQRIRGADRAVDTALVVTGYDNAAVATFAADVVARSGSLDPAGDVTGANYRFACALARGDLDG
jgi:hypothetical protein